MSGLSNAPWSEFTCKLPSFDVETEQSNGKLPDLLIDRNADLEARNDRGLTPWLIATGSGVVDTAVALSQAGCDVFAVTQEGTNAADRCSSSSTQMRTYLRVC